MSNEQNDQNEAVDAYLDSVVERTLDTYRDLVAPEVLALMRELIVESLTEDEVGRDLFERARPRAAPAHTRGQPAEGATRPEKKAGGRDG